MRYGNDLILPTHSRLVFKRNQAAISILKKVFDVAQTSGQKPAAPTLDRDPRKLVAIMLDTAPILSLIHI